MIQIKDTAMDQYVECDDCGGEAVVILAKKISLCVDCAHELGEALVEI